MVEHEVLTKNMRHRHSTGMGIEQKLHLGGQKVNQGERNDYVGQNRIYWKKNRRYS